ncbi:hypothetical protein NF27_HE00070 [Candidatus Jidaibacter acanthamoeba]|uniref:Uncharacterized protein n=1 Tax=Candidatus Jidaibacter acanthamoebae TaxID=86105 RepID=A0A0C1QKF5_9RICK|nr:hypothetical protein [Candidatus Jidaibacter acanthamoeba]KIE04618.1 hypothetical protein NF27_HE00070 [Candidatus Jidaibacter acanthamoeba]
MLNKKQHDEIDHFNPSSFKPTSLFGDPAEAYGTLEHNLDKNTPEPGSDGREEKASSDNTGLDVRVRKSPGIAVNYPSPISMARIIGEKKALKEQLEYGKPEQEKTILIEAESSTDEESLTESSTSEESSLETSESCEVVSTPKPQRIYIDPKTITRVVGFQIPQVTPHAPTGNNAETTQENLPTSRHAQVRIGSIIIRKENPFSHVEKGASASHVQRAGVTIGNTRINNQGGRGC